MISKIEISMTSLSEKIDELEYWRDYTDSWWGEAMGNMKMFKKPGD